MRRRPSISFVINANMWNNDTIRDLERRSIRSFVAQHKQCLKGRVLDFGAGTPTTCRTPQPYRDLVEGEYVAYDVDSPSVWGPWDAILCTQVVQYIPDVPKLLSRFEAQLVAGGYLVMTYPTNWAEVEGSDLWRFTRAGMERLLHDAELEVLHHERRAEVTLGGFAFALGYGVVAKKAGL